jgi:hexosaminidase
MNLIPQPVSYKSTEGQFTLSPSTVIVASGEAAPIALQLALMLAPATGWIQPVQVSTPGKGSTIQLRLNPRLKRLGPEGYRLEALPQQIRLSAPEPAGLYSPCQPLRQLLPAEIFRDAPVGDIAWTVPCCRIEDFPRFSWRGSLLDCCRHFMPKSFVKKYIDLLALHKLNVLHWHLTEDQGWRIEIKKYPRLTQVGAWRKETLVGKMIHDNVDGMTFDGVRHGGFYTQDDIREIVSYAAQRFVTIVPEIEMPGHAQAALAAYPELGNTGEALEVRTYWGVNENIFNLNESTFTFLEDVLTEVMELFPSKFIHVGGDEVPKKQWQDSPAAQTRKRELGLKDEEELQSYFIRRMDAFLAAKGRRLIGWDEILEGGLAAGATVMSWRGEKAGIVAANSGHDVVMAPHTYTYLDYYQSDDQPGEPPAIGGFLPLKKVYSYEPVAKGISRAAARRVLGAQGQLWAEYLPTPRQVEFMAFPRLSALAEVVWTPARRKDYAGFLERLTTHLQRLEFLDVNYRPLK